MTKNAITYIYVLEYICNIHIAIYVFIEFYIYYCHIVTDILYITEIQEIRIMTMCVTISGQ